MQPLKGALAVPDFAGKRGTRIWLACNDPSWLVARHGVQAAGVSQAMAEAVAAVASEAAGRP
jgi:hypothetical protein